MPSELLKEVKTRSFVKILLLVCFLPSSTNISLVPFSLSTIVGNMLQQVHFEIFLFQLRELQFETIRDLLPTTSSTLRAHPNIFPLSYTPISKETTVKFTDDTASTQLLALTFSHLSDALLISVLN
ncbi:hypothetical protein BLNAU_19763 [Blattamonas nauphoetae]|uniref:Uncharacterized protein n=1 Tax=Blattamonas nauphoetae TaxID=2049346 RepID=A0ABQ9X0N3_9EUKA|nr:hypothetical protein BLNAU_19763 [Blattamonas nauphoetae]